MDPSRKRRQRNPSGYFHKGQARRSRLEADLDGVPGAGAGEYDDFYFGGEPEPDAEDAAGGGAAGGLRERRRRRMAASDAAIAIAADGSGSDSDVDEYELGERALIAAGQGAIGGASADGHHLEAAAAAAPGAPPPAGAGPPGGAAAALPVPVAPAAVPVARIDVDDDLILFGDVPREALDNANVDERYLPLVLQNWASRHVVADLAVTDLLKLFHGEFGRRLGVRAELTTRGGAIPETANTAYKAGRVLIADLGFGTLLLPGWVRLTEGDDGLKARGTARVVGYWYAPDLAHNILFKLMDPLLNSPEAPMFIELDPSLPGGLFCGPTYFNAAETAERRDAFERTRAALPALCARLGIDPSRVRIIAVGASNFIDAVSPLNNQGTTVYAHLIGVSNLHPAVAQSPLSVVLAGLWNPPAVLSAKKIAGEDTGMNASMRTKGNAAAIDALLQSAVVTEPMRKLLEREPLITRSSHFPGLSHIPEQVGAAEEDARCSPTKLLPPPKVRGLYILPLQHSRRRARHGARDREERAPRLHRRRKWCRSCESESRVVNH